MDSTDDQNDEQEAGPISLRDALAAEFHAAKDSDSPTDDDATGVPPTDDDDTLEASDDEQSADSDSPEDDESRDEPEVISAPEHWSDEDREVFDTLPSAAREAWLRREKEYDKGIQGKSEELKTIEEAFADYDEILKLRGVDRATAIRTWVAAQSAMDANPVNGLKMLIQSFGPEVQAAFEAEFGQKGASDDIPPAEDDGSFKYTDPEVIRLRKELEESKRQTQAIEAQQESLTQRQAMAQVAQFKDATDAEGNLLHPHFDAVRGHMQALLTSGYAPNLEKAYEEAVWSLPEYRKELAEKETAERKAAEEARRRKAAAEAAKKQGVVNGQGTKPPPPPKQRTLRDELRQAYRDSQRGGS